MGKQAPVQESRIVLQYYIPYFVCQAITDMKNKTLSGIIVFTILFLVISSIRYHDFLFALPYGLHEEAQADRLALAIQFYDEGMNFFKPRTYNMAAEDRIVAAEFPIHSYATAALAHIFGREHINAIYRLLTLVMVYAGLLALYLTAFKATRDRVISLFVPFFLFCSPVFAYYACTSMPDAAAVGTSFIGFYFFYLWLSTQRFSSLRTAIIFFTVATLIKTTLGIVLLAGMSYAFLNIFLFSNGQTKKQKWEVVWVCAASLSVILAYYFYNQYLIARYHGYVFVLRVLPFENWEEIKLYFTYSLRHTYINEYFIVPQYPFIFLLLISGSLALYMNKSRNKWLLFFVIMFTGTTITTFLFGHQLIHHDYYFMSMWMPALTIALLTGIIEVRNTINTSKGALLLNSAAVTTLLILIVFAHSYFNSRMLLEDYRYPGIKKALRSNWMHGGAEKLDKLGIGRDSAIFVLDEGPANTALVYFDRKGMNAPRGAWEGNILNVREYMNRQKIHIMVCDARKMPEIEATYTPVFNELFSQLYRDEHCAIYALNN